MLSEIQLEAAALVAQGKLTRPQIAEQFGIGVRTLAEWKADPEFQAEVDRLTKDWREGVRKRGIANKENRLANLNGLHRRSVAFMRHRARMLAIELQAELREMEARRLVWTEQGEVPPDVLGALAVKEKALKAAIPMVKTGMCRMELKSLHDGKESYQVIREVFYDHQLEAAIRAQMQQAAIEMGDWKTTVEHTGKGGGPVESNLTVTFVKPKETEK